MKTECEGFLFSPLDGVAESGLVASDAADFKDSLEVFLCHSTQSTTTAPSRAVTRLL